MSPTWQMVVFLLIASSVWAVLHFGVGLRLIRPLGLDNRRSRRLWLVVAALWALGPLTMIGERWIDHDALWWLPIRWGGYTYMGLFTVLFILLFASNLWVVPARIARWRRERAAKSDGADNPERRHFLVNATNASALGLSGVLSAWGLWEARRDPAVVEQDVPIAGLPPALEGYRIAQLSDVHIGPMLKGDWLETVVARANDAEPDLIAVTGDLVDGLVAELRDHVAPLGALSAPDGVFFVTGNHEYYWNALEWCEEIGRIGLTVLNNEHRVVSRDGATVLVAGATDYNAHRYVEEHESSPAKAKEGAPACDFELLLAHQPKSVHAAAEAGFDLQLSGHTHAGQFVPFNLLARFAHPYFAGLNAHDDRLKIYVSPGTGWWGPPHRAGVPAEITVLRLVAA